MANDTELERKQLQVFCGGAGEQQTSVFGTMKNPTPDYSKDPETLQGTNWPQGWQNAIAADDAPFMEDMNSLFYVLSYMTKYLYQHGIPEWNNKETYTASKSVVLRNGKFYLAKQTSGADNPQDPATDSSNTYWYMALDPVNPPADQNWVFQNFVGKTGDETISGIKTFQDNITAPNQLDYTLITNCITKIPQDIKLELSNGTLTLKAGSKVYVPNGAGVFKEILVNSDISLTDTTNYNNLFVFYNNGILERILTSQVFSGTTAPSTTSFLYWYDTTNNLIKKTTNGGDTWTSGNISFPLGLFSTNGSGFSSIDQVFNGFGYIGSTIFVLPNVEGLIPNGRNTDGSLNSIKFTTTSVLTSSRGFSGSLKVYLRENSLVYSSGIYYNELANENQSVGTNIYSNFCEVGTLTADSTGRVTSFSPKLPVKLADNQEVVHKTGNETIEGEKIFTSNITISNPNGVSIMQCVDPANTNNNAKIQYYVGDNSASFTNVQNGSTIGGIRIDNSGYAYSIKPPVATDKSTQIATTQWVRNYGAQLDYSAAITISGTGEKTASVNGVLIGTPIKNNSNESLEITIDGKTFFFAPGNSGEDNTHLSQCYLPVAKGQSYNVVRINGNVQLLLVPYV